MSMELIKKTLYRVAQFYDARKVGENGRFGFRRSSDLMILYRCLDKMIDEEIIKPESSVFLDLGCADGRVNLFFSYITKASVGIEIDDWSLDEYDILLKELLFILKKEKLLLPPDNIYLFRGDASDIMIYEKIKDKLGFGIEDFDIFYTYLFMYEELSKIIGEKGKKGAVFIIYGIGDIIPHLPNFQPLNGIPLEGILGVYKKI